MENNWKPAHSIRTQVTESTWLGRKGVSTTYHYQNKWSTGLRIEVMVWADNGETTVRLIKGDGRTPKFKEFFSQTLQKPTEQSIREVVFHIDTVAHDMRVRNGAPMA